MSGTNTVEGGNQFAQIVLNGQIGTALTSILGAEAIVPGSAPSYELCKQIFAYHTLGAKMAEKPIDIAQSQERELSVSATGDERLIEAFRREWAALGDGVGADTIIKNLKTQSRIYGIASMVMGDRNKLNNIDKPVDWDGLAETNPYFNVFDPLNTAGSLVLDQDPLSPNFQKPISVTVAGKTYHPSRTLIVMNESPLYIEWSNSAFGFVGRSVYQRALFPLKTFLQSQITDWLVTVKCGLLVYKAKPPGSVQNQRVLRFFGFKRSQLQGGVSGQVLTIDKDEDIESLNFQNLEGPAKFARDNALKNTAMAVGMPAKLLEQEEMVGGMAEGAEDAKQIAQYIDRMRIEMAPEYRFFDRVTQCRAWTPAFFETMKKDYPNVYGKVSYKTAFYQWCNSFSAKWPNLLAEPESQQIQVEKTRFESVTALVEVLQPLIKVQENRAQLLDWAAEEINGRRKLFSSALVLDTDAEAKYEPPPGLPMGEGAEEKLPEPFGSNT